MFPIVTGLECTLTLKIVLLLLNALGKLSLIDIICFHLSLPLQRNRPVVIGEEQGQRVGRLGGGHVRHDSRGGAASASQVRSRIHTPSVLHQLRGRLSLGLSTFIGRVFFRVFQNGILGMPTGKLGGQADTQKARGQ